MSEDLGELENFFWGGFLGGGGREGRGVFFFLDGGKREEGEREEGLGEGCDGGRVGCREMGKFFLLFFLTRFRGFGFSLYGGKHDRLVFSCSKVTAKRHFPAQYAGEKPISTHPNPSSALKWKLEPSASLLKLEPATALLEEKLLTAAPVAKRAAVKV